VGGNVDELDFVYLEESLSLRQVVDAVREDVSRTGKKWYRYHVVFGVEGAYRCARLSRLTAQVEDLWRARPDARVLGLSACDLDLETCAVVPAHRVRPEMLSQVRAAYIVGELGGRPAVLYQGQSRRAVSHVGSAGWWRLVGRRLAELGQVPEWPNPLPETVHYDPVLVIEPRTSLADLAQQVKGAAFGDATLLAVPLPDGWCLCAARDLLQRIQDEYPDAGPVSQVGAFVDSLLDTPTVLQRAETPWELVTALLASSPGSRLLVVDGSSPLGVLSRRSRQYRGLATRDGNGWARFLAQSAQIRPTARDRGRALNCWFADRSRNAIAHTYALEANQAYLLGVNVGPPSPRAHSVGAQTGLDSRVVNYALGTGAPLLIRVDSDDLVILDEERTIVLPKDGPSEDVYLRIVTPVRTGECALRVGVYFEQNLVQSHRVYVRVAPSEGEMPEGAGDGWWSECEYALTLDLAHLQDLDARRASVWIGDDRLDRWTLGVRLAGGVSTGPALKVSSHLVAEALARYRELLLESCLWQDGGQIEYLYRADHSPHDPLVFEQSIRDLAELGQVLYERVFGEGRGREVADRLRALGRPGGQPLVVQIARLDLDAGLPWAVLYDRPLHYHPTRNVVCQRFVGGAGCQVGCPYLEDVNVICPYGFWGLRYIVEQPLLPSGVQAPVVTRLRAASRPRIAMVYGDGLSMSAYHRQRLDAVAGEKAECVVLDTTEGLLGEMMAGPEVVYLYCHAGNTPYRQWLVVREDDPLLAAHLNDRLRTAWRARVEEGASPPLIILNGCSTGDYDPSTLLSFIHRFAALGAAGVVGTEIPIHEYLGRAFGEFFVGRLLCGEPVGKIVYDFRNALLKRKNLLGLAYVPYCYASLRLVTVLSDA